MTEDKVSGVKLSGESLEKLLAYLCSAPMSHIINTGATDCFDRTGYDCVKLFEGKQQR